MSSDRSLNFDDKPLINALDVLNKLERAEYDQTLNLVDQYPTDTP